AAASWRASRGGAVSVPCRLVRLGWPPVSVLFAHRPATIARFACLLAGVPYGLSAHAKDIWLTPDRELVRKVRDAAIVLTCTAEGKRHLERLSNGRTPVRLGYHGVDHKPHFRIRADDSSEPGVSTG